MSFFRQLIELVKRTGKSPAAEDYPALYLSDWRRLMAGGPFSWVLFKHGTGVLIFEPGLDLRTEAIELLRRFGPVGAGSSHGDFDVRQAPGDSGWMVSCHHHQILTYVRPDELAPEKRDFFGIGLYGRAKRGKDATELEVIHVEDASRNVPASQS